jgi:hypothetical protein
VSAVAGMVWMDSLSIGASVGATTSVAGTAASVVEMAAATVGTAVAALEQPEAKTTKRTGRIGIYLRFRFIEIFFSKVFPLRGKRTEKILFAIYAYPIGFYCRFLSCRCCFECSEKGEVFFMPFTAEGF